MEKRPVTWWHRASVYQIYPLSFQDSNGASGIDYKYSVQSVDEFGIVSEASDEVSLSSK